MEELIADAPSPLAVPEFIGTSRGLEVQNPLQNVLEAPNARPARRLQSIDFLRGLAALAVVAHHAMSYGPALVAPPLWFAAIAAIFAQGLLGVPLFFVISGFCIHLNRAKAAAAKQVAPSLSWQQFWYRRLHRLYPPYLVVLICSMLTVIVAMRAHLNVPLVSAYSTPHWKWMSLDFISHAFMLHGLIPVFDRLGGNPPFWTLAREEYFYLLYAGLCFAMARIGLKLTVASVAIVGIAVGVAGTLLIAPTSPWFGLVASSALALWSQWCLGMVAVEYYYGLCSLPRIVTSWWAIPAWGAIAKFSEHLCQPLSPLLWGLCFFTLVNVVVSRERSKSSFSSNRFTKWITGAGVFSYSLYLVHYPVRAVVKSVMGRFVHVETQNPVLYLIYAAIMGIAGYFTARLFFRMVESRFLNTSTKTNSDPLIKADAPAIALSATAIKA